MLHSVSLWVPVVRLLLNSFQLFFNVKLLTCILKLKTHVSFVCYSGSRCIYLFPWIIISKPRGNYGNLANLKSSASPSRESLILPIKFISLPCGSQTLGPQLSKLVIHSMGKGTELWVHTWAKAKHAVPVVRRTCQGFCSTTEYLQVMIFAVLGYKPDGVFQVLQAEKLLLETLGERKW